MRRSRAPQGARGLKYSNRDFKSMPRGRAPQGARGLKFLLVMIIKGLELGRAPQGARGLKYYKPECGSTENPSRPARGAWVEIP